MRIVRFALKNQTECFYGEECQGLIYPLAATQIQEVPAAPRTGQAYTQKQVQVLAPCEPSKIICLGLNYKDHAEEFAFELPKFPVVFLKPPTTVIGSNQEILYPNDYSRRLDYEGELAIVIGSSCKNVSLAQAEANLSSYVLGYTCGNDVTARDLQPKNGQWTIAKSFDTFMPLGPAIETNINPKNLEIKTILNGKVVQQANTNLLIFDVPYLISYLSNSMTLLPGDVIITGTPSGVGPMLAGDEIVIEIENIGRLTNKVALKYPFLGYKPKKS